MRTSRSHADLAPAAYQGLLQVSRYLSACGLERGLQELVKTRVSQLNGCGFCLDMHATAALQEGESQRRLNLLPAWREAAVFSPRERAALAWAEALTELPRHRVDEALYLATRQHFSEQELVDLTYVISLIGAWNRLGVAFLPDLPGEVA
jgi:AhpD family alkylhydroperoxidase